jgi:hypothetical protein
MRFTGPSAKTRGPDPQALDTETTLVGTRPETLERTTSH